MRHQHATMFEQAVLPLFEEHRADWLGYARNVAFMLGIAGKPITIDDVRAICPPPSHVDPRVMGAVFERSKWTYLGPVSSKRSTCHKRPVGQWQLKNPPLETAE
jgi:hypothetical protein